MRFTLQQRGQLLRRLIFMSPRITIFGVIALLLLLALIVLGVIIFQQDRAYRSALGYNYSDVNRPFTQFERELLRLSSLVVTDPAQYDPQKVQTEKDLLSSRWQVIFWPTIQDVLPDETKAATEQMKPYWATLQSLLATWQTAPNDETVRSDITQTITGFDFLVYNTEVSYQALRSVKINQINNTSESLLFALGGVFLLLVVFVVVVAVSIYRFVREARIAEAQTQAARTAEAAALENSRFKDQFLAVMSHELRTPLNAIIGFLGIMAMSGKLDEKNAHMVQRIRANAERLLALINDILDLNKLKSGRMELAATTVYPRELTERWRDQMDVLAKQKGLGFIIEVDDSLPKQVEIDEGAITKIVTNLLSNAFKFTHEGTVNLKMWARDKVWVIEVKDTGIGIPAPMHDVIFESFQQVDNSFKRPYGGTGLGLSIVQHLVKIMGGSIRLESTVGKGTTFIVTLPIKTPEKSDVQGQSTIQFA